MKPSFTEELAAGTAKELFWKAAQVAAEVAHPGGGAVVRVIYQVTKAASAAQGVGSGDGFDLKICVLGTGLDGLCLALRFREMQEESGSTPELSLYLDVSFIDPLSEQKIDGDGPRERGKRPVEVAENEWWWYLGREAVINHALVLDHIRELSAAEATALLADAERSGASPSQRVTVAHDELTGTARSTIGRVPIPSDGPRHPTANGTEAEEARTLDEGTNVAEIYPTEELSLLGNRPDSRWERRPDLDDQSDGLTP